MRRRSFIQRIAGSLLGVVGAVYCPGLLSAQDDFSLPTNAYPRWSNYTIEYSPLGKKAFSEAMRSALSKVKFEPPVSGWSSDA